MNHISVEHLDATIRRLEQENAQLRTENAQLREENARLQSENVALKNRVAELQTRVSQLEARIARLEAELEAAHRAAKRQAAPFSKGPPRQHPKSPGRKPGPNYGRKARRPPPPPEQIDELYDVSLPDVCPDCGGRLKEDDVEPQYHVDIPVRPIVRQFNVHRGHCTCCGHAVQGRHPLQTSDALGAAASQVGPAAQAAIVLLNKYAGLSHGKIVALFAQLFGISLSRGGSAQIVLRAAQRSQAAYRQILESIRGSPWAVPDETGWRVGGRPTWLHVLVGRDATCYQIDRRRTSDVAAGVLGWDYAGTLVHDGLTTYDRFHQAAHQQCVGHLMRRARKLLERAVGGAVHFPRRVLELFEEALSLRDGFGQGALTADDLAEAYLRLLLQLDHLVRTPKQNDENRKLAKHLANHLRDWFWFLLEPGLDATNYRAEQALRPAVVNRKVWGGNRTDAGTEAQGVLMSILETCRRHGQAALDFLRDVLCGRTPTPILGH